MEQELKERFENELWILNKNGDQRSTFIYIKSIISQRIDVNGKIVDFDFLLSKYKEYLNKWNYDHGSKTKEQLVFIGVKNQLKSIESFIIDKDFKKSFEISSNSTTKYLFQNISVKELTKSLNKWINMQKEKKSISLQKEKSLHKQ